MALRARLVAPPPATRTEWPWHDAKASSIAASALLRGDRRLEAATYLSSGFGIRTSLESKPGCRPFAELAKAWMPGRLKGIQVGPDTGTPFLAATQVFDARPIPRKWLALARTADAGSRFVKRGMILVTCSGSVGRTTVGFSAHQGMLVSHDLLRIEPLASEDRGWVYAFLHSPQARAMMTSAHYGHIIKHLESHHIGSIPVPPIDESVSKDLTDAFDKIVALRERHHALTLEAEQRFQEALGLPKLGDDGESGFAIKASELFKGRRRLEAVVHNPTVSELRAHLAENGHGFTSIASGGYQLWLPSRFKRIPAEEGVYLLDSAAITEVNPDVSKRIADGDFGDEYRARVEEGWVLMPRSGQTYGIIGTAVLAGDSLEEYVVSDHVMRMKPAKDCSIDPGYLVTALTHPVLGRPLVKALAYGSSIPEIEVADMANFDVVRVEAAEEDAIAKLARAAALARSQADMEEKRVARVADDLIQRFLAK